MTGQPDRFKGECVGRPVFVLGNGPSMLDWTPEELDELGAATVGVNTCWRGAHEDNPNSDHPGFTEVDYYAFVSSVYVDQLMGGAVKIRRCAFLPQDYTARLEHSSSTFEGAWCGLRRFGGSTPGGFRYDLRRGFSANFAGYMGLQVAAHVCADPHRIGKIVLIGFDAVDGQGHHFDPDPHEPGQFLPKITRGGMRRWFGGVREWVQHAKLAEVVVYGKDSGIEDLPRMDKEEVLEWLRQSGYGSTEQTTASSSGTSDPEDVAQPSRPRTGGTSRRGRGGKSSRRKSSGETPEA